jgi:hypothetical protein
MANGTIAFDTLQTSGQITGTAKSVDTDFLASSIPKAFVGLTGTGTIAIKKSLNITSITDSGTGNYTVTINNDFEDANYTFIGGVSWTIGVTNSVNGGLNSTDTAAGSYKNCHVNAADAATDAVVAYSAVIGELA